MSLEDMSLDSVVAHCTEETHKYWQRLLSDTRYCFELFRRALVEARQEAFTYVYRIYEPQVRAWVYNHSQFNRTDETADYFVSLSFSKLFFALRGEKFNKFSSLGHVLKYLNMCVFTGILEYLRSQPRDAETLEEESAPYNPSPSSELAGELQTHINRILEDAQDRLLVHLVYVLNLKPAEIQQQYPDQWDSARAVSVALQRIRRHLRKDQWLREWADMG